MKKIIFFLLALFAISEKTSASHIIGGNIYVTWLSGNDYKVTLTVWRDCSPSVTTGFDPSCIISSPTGGKPFTDTRYLGQEVDILLGIYDKATNQKVDSLYMHLLSKKILALGDACYKPNNVCVEEGIYTRNMTLNGNPNGLYIAWQRCCRNAVIINATDPGNNGPAWAGMVFYAAIPNPDLHNSTPEFGTYPQAYMCANKLNTLLDFKASDKDGDSLVYSLVDPKNGFTQSTQAPGNGINGQLWGTINNVAQCNTFKSPVTTQGPFPTIKWVAPYSLTNIVGGSPAMAINRNTGVITASPVIQGFYVFAVLVEEFRNGVKIGEIQREVQYQVIQCGGNLPPVFSQPTTGTSISYTITAGDSLCIPIVLNDPNTSDSIFISASGTIFNNPKIPKVTFLPVKGIKSGTTKLCAVPTCGSVSDIPYNIKLVGRDTSNCDGNSVTMNIDVYVKPANNAPPVFSQPTTATSISYTITAGDTLCFPIVLNDPDLNDSIFISGSGTIFNNPKFANVTFKPVKGLKSGTTELCAISNCGTASDTPYKIQFNGRDTSKCGANSVTLDVDVLVIPGKNAPPVFSQPTTATSISYTITAGDTLCFPVVLNDPDPNDSIFISGSGTILNNPQFPNVTFKPVKGLKSGTTELCAISNCETISNTPYKIQFTGSDLSGCGKNTITMDVDVLVKPDIAGKIPYIPNVFTPNGDNKNDFFHLDAEADYCTKDFSIKIYNRWGKLVYVSSELGFNWNGKNYKSDKDAPDGVYYYIINATFSNSSFENHGFLTLLR